MSRNSYKVIFSVGEEPIWLGQPQPFMVQPMNGPSDKKWPSHNEEKNGPVLGFSLTLIIFVNLSLFMIRKFILC